MMTKTIAVRVSSRPKICVSQTMKYKEPYYPSISVLQIRKVKSFHDRPKNIHIDTINSIHVKSNSKEIEYKHPITPIKSENSLVLTKNKVQAVNTNAHTLDDQSIEQLKGKDVRSEKSTLTNLENQRRSPLPSPSRYIQEGHYKYQTKKNRKYLGRYPFRKCSPLCTYIILITFILLAAATAAIVFAFTQHKSVSTTTTTTTTTSVTTATAATTSVTTATATTASVKTTTETTTSVTTTTATTTAHPFVSLLRSGDFIIGIYNTTAGGSTGGRNGTFSSSNEYPAKAIDGSLNTKYLNFGGNNSSTMTIYAGIGTGFYATPTISSATIARSLLFGTANDAENRDPMTVTLEGTNSTAFDLGSSWTLIYNGSTGIDPINIPNRTTYCVMQNFSNTIAFQSYRLLITSKRGSDNSVQYSEAQIWGYY